MNKKQALTAIAKDITNCSICQENSLGEAVPGEGNPDAKIVFVGEAPGKKEAATGRPFVGRSGQFLRQQIRSIGLLGETVFITSAVKYLPKKGTPSVSQIEHSRPHLIKQLEIIQPKVVVLLGSVAAQSMLKEKISIAKEHGTIKEIQGVYYFLSYHPAAAVRFLSIRKSFEQDFILLGDLIKKLRI